MNIINRETGYAVKAICFMVKEDAKLVTSRQLADYFGISRTFLRKILQKLNQVGVLKSYKGKKGGFCLARRLDQIFLIDLIHIFQGPLQLSGCYTQSQQCPLVQRCPIQQELEILQEKLTNDLSQISMKMLIDKQNKDQNLQIE